MADNILSIRALEKTYPNGVRALKGISFDVKKGEFLVVIGLSGSGKSTLLRCINRLHDPTSGEIIFKGSIDSHLHSEKDKPLDIAKAQGAEIKKIRTKIGMIFQHFNLIPRHSVMSNVLMGKLGQMSTWKSIFGLFSKEDREQALKYLNLVGIAEKAKIRADQLSGGQQQRVAIARALTQNPQLLLADEPVASLDPATCHVVMDYLKKVNQELGITIICNLHFLSLVRQYATRVIALKNGELVYEGSPIEIDEAWFEKIYGEGSKEVHIN
jgi:phosphonate transport system ATP-binding protein